jgi:hypothetical protein
MPPDPSDLDPQKLWQSQQTEHVPITLSEIHDKSSAFQTKIKRRNLIEYAACVVVVLGFLPGVLDRVSWMMQAGSALIILATVFVAWQLHQRASAERTPETGGALTDFYRTQLTRQRDAVGSIAAWYIAPFVPGMTLLLTGVWFVRGSNHLFVLFTGALVIVVFAGIWWLNQHAAARLQRQLDAVEPPRP